MMNYLNYAVWDWIFCTAVSAGLAANVYNGYEMTDALSGNFAAILLFTAAAEALFVCGGYSRRTRLAMVGVCAASLAAAVVYMNRTKPFLHEEERSVGIFWILLLFCALVVYLLSRLKTGGYLLLAVGNFVIAAEVFLEFGLHLPGYLFFLSGSILLIFWHAYLRGLAGTRKGKVQSGRYVLQMAAVGAAALALGLLVVWTVLVPLRLPTRELKLIQSLQSMEIIHKVGVYALLPDIDWQAYASSQPDTRTTSNRASGGKEETEEEGADAETAGESTQDTENTEAAAAETEEEPESRDESREEEQEAIRYDRRNRLILCLCLLAGLAAAFSVWLKKRQRARFFEKLCALPREEAVVKCYRFYLRALGKLHVKKQGYLTLKEFAGNSRKYTEAYFYGDYGFPELTEIYNKVYYGEEEVSEAEWNMFKDCYWEFYENIREELGKWRYSLIFYRI